MFRFFLCLVGLVYYNVSGTTGVEVYSDVHDTTPSEVYSDEYGTTLSGVYSDEYDTTPDDTTLGAMTSPGTTASPRGIFRIPKTARHLGAPPPRSYPWVSDVLHRALRGFTPRGSSECERHGRLYREHLHNLTLWAVQMYDASAQAALGLLAGDSYQLGHYDECVSLNVAPLELTGRYCLADIRFTPQYPGFRSPHPELKFSPPDNRLPVWERIKNTSDLSHRPRDLLHWSLCVPASCTTSEVKSSLTSALRDLDLDLHLDLGDLRCHAAVDEPPPSLGFYVVWAVILVAVVVSMVATGMDFFVYQAGRPHNRAIRRWLRTFSMYKNMGKLVTPNSNTDFAEFHVYKLIAIMFVVSGHRQMYNIGQTPLYNVDWVEKLNSYFADVVILNGGVVVDSFFVLSGFLTCHHILQELDKHGRFNFALVFFNRWIRIAPVYMLVVAFYTFVFPHLGDGPLWTERLSLESARCLENWWTNLLFVNNYVHSDNQCMVQSWYLACDMHFFMVGSLLVYCLWRWPRLGRSLLALCTAAAIVVPALITYRHRYYGAVLHYMSLMRDPMSVQHYRDMYIPSHVRAGPYLVGIVAAYLYLKLRQTKYTFSQRSLVCGSLLAGVLLVGSIAVGWICYDRARPYHRLENALYAGLHRTAWAVGLSWFIVAEATTGFGVFYRTMKHRFFTPFGRLTYCVFLVHTIPQIYLTASSRVPEYLSVPKLFWMVTGDGAAAYILALALNLLFEAPLERVHKKTIRRLLGGKGDGSAKTNGLELAQNGVHSQGNGQETNKTINSIA